MPISPRNKKIMGFDDSHPAKRFLVEHDQFCRDCVGFEISYSGRPAIDDVAWHSQYMKRATLSSVLYAYLSFTPIMHGWIDRRSDISEINNYERDRIRICRLLLNEAIEAAHQSGAQAAEMIAERALGVLSLWEQSILLLESCGPDMGSSQSHQPCA